MFCRQERQGDLKIALLGKAEHGTLDHTWIVLLRGLSLFWPLAFADIKALSNHVFEEETQHPVSTGTPEETHSVNSGTWRTSIMFWFPSYPSSIHSHQIYYHLLSNRELLQASLLTALHSHPLLPFAIHDVLPSPQELPGSTRPYPGRNPVLQFYMLHTKSPKGRWSPLKNTHIAHLNKTYCATCSYHHTKALGWSWGREASTLCPGMGLMRPEAGNPS